MDEECTAEPTLPGSFVYTLGPGRRDLPPDPRMASYRASYALVLTSLVPLPALMFAYPSINNIAYS